MWRRLLAPMLVLLWASAAFGFTSSSSGGAVAGGTCTGGMFMTGITAGGSPVCGTPSGGAPFPPGSPPQITGFSAVNAGEAETLGGDATLARTGTNAYGITVTKTNGVAFGAAATLGVGTGLTSSGGNINLTTPISVANGGLGTITAPTTGQIITAQSASAYGPVTLSGDATISSLGALTVTKTNGVAFTGLATAAIPLSIANGGSGSSTAPSIGQIDIASSTTAFTPVTMSGDATITSTGAITVTKSGGTALTSLFAPLTNPTGGQNNYAPLAGPTFTGLLTTPQLLLTNTSSTQLFFGSTTSPVATFISVAPAPNFNMATGAYWNGTTWISSATHALTFQMWGNGDIAFSDDTGLTVGNGFSPTLILAIKQTGLNLEVGNYSLNGTVFGGTCAAGQFVSAISSGVIPTCTTPTAGFTAGGDLSGTSTSQTVIGIQTKAVPTPASGYLHYNGTTMVWDTPAASGGYPNGAPPQITGFSATNTAEAETLSGDATLTRAGANSYTLAVTATNGVAFTTAATTAIGTSGGTIPLLNAANTWSGVQSFNAGNAKVLGTSTGGVTLASADTGAPNYTATFPNNTGTVAETNIGNAWSAAQNFTASGITLRGSAAGTTTFTSANASTTNYTLTIPAATDTMAVLGQNQTFTGVNTFNTAPVMSGASITSATIPMAALTGTLPIANGGRGSTTAPTAGQIDVASSTTAFTPVTMSGDATITTAGAITVTKLNGTTPGGSCTGNQYVLTVSSSGVPTCGSLLAPLASPVVTSPTFNGHVLNGTGLQIATGAGCTTGASMGSNCVSTLTFPNAFADTSYYVLCSCNGTTAGSPSIAFESIANASQANVLTVASSAAAATCQTVVCLGIHP